MTSILALWMSKRARLGSAQHTDPLYTPTIFTQRHSNTARYPDVPPIFKARKTSFLLHDNLGLIWHQGGKESPVSTYIQLWTWTNCIMGRADVTLAIVTFLQAEMDYNGQNNRRLMVVKWSHFEDNIIALIKKSSFKIHGSKLMLTASNTHSPVGLYTDGWCVC